MTEAAIIQKTQLENRVTTTEDELKQARLQHQWLYQAYKDLVMQDRDQSSDTEYPEFGKRTATPKQEKFVIKVFNKKRTGNSEKHHAPHTGSSRGSSNTTNRDSNNRGSSHRGASGTSSKHHKRRYEAYQKPESKKVSSDSKDICKNPICVAFGRKHTALQCFSKTNPSMLEELKKRTAKAE
ncbi:hypothetical protein BGX26_001712 [Mortierella sp. AD094]|nr:hypothetical protein BGX26_001712 [Mortierella sp. AD094]